MKRIILSLSLLTLAAKCHLREEESQITQFWNNHIYNNFRGRNLAEIEDSVSKVT